MVVINFPNSRPDRSSARWLRRCLALIGLSILFAPMWQQTAHAEDVDIELVLAVDGSGSISLPELQLQIAGYVEAFRDPDVQTAALSGPLGKAAVALVIWSDARFPKSHTGWHVIASREDADAFAERILALYQTSADFYGSGKGATEIGGGIVFAIGMIEGNDMAGRRKIVDVSGDGIETLPYSKSTPRLPYARDLASQLGVQINGLAILEDVPLLYRYYRNNVIVGPGSFVMEARNFESFAAAIKKKLLKELEPELRVTRNEAPRLVHGLRTEATRVAQ